METIVAVRAKDIAAEYLAERTERELGSELDVMDVVADWRRWLEVRTDIMCNDLTEHLISPAIVCAGVERRKVRRSGKIVSRFMGIRLKRG